MKTEPSNEPSDLEPLTLKERFIISRPAIWWFQRQMKRGHESECGCTVSRFRKRPIAICLDHVMDRLGYRMEGTKVVQKDG